MLVGDMFAEIGRPLFLVIWISMWLTAATELGPDSWIPTIFNDVMQSGTQAGILQLVWINGHVPAAAVRRRHLAQRLTSGADRRHRHPGGARPVSVQPGAHGCPGVRRGALFAVGIAFWWPTMLGITSERFPRGGALALAIIGATGSFATAIAGPVMGRISDSLGVTAQNPERAGEVLAWWALLPVTLIVIFGLIYLRDKAAGGYRVERISAVRT